MSPRKKAAPATAATGPASRLSDDDVYLFNEGTHRGLAQLLGAHVEADGVRFAVWAPRARQVTVIGDFNDWDASQHPLAPRGRSGIWEGWVTSAAAGQVYKYAITTEDGRVLEKADPYAACAEHPPRTGSVIWDLDYAWQDARWMATRGERNALSAPMSIYELHLGSWRRDPARPDEVVGYREIAPELIRYVRDTGFTHVEFMPLAEHPFYGSWGYQVTSYFAPSRRYGTPQDLMALIDELHAADIGVIVDWVPSHFPTDAFALAGFDGAALYEHPDPRRGYHPDWQTLIFDYGRPEVRAFLASSAEHWLSAYHADAIRVDAVASMLYLDYSRQDGEWLPNVHGGREHLEAIEFLKTFNAGVYADHPDVQTIAEESTAWPGVSRPVDHGGLGFGLKWDMGWMHDTLEYLGRDPLYRRHHHGQVTFRGVYAYTENFVLPLSHDEVVYGKGSLLNKMPGDRWQKFANLRLLLGYQFTQPGKKLLFMGDEFGALAEWNHDAGLDWSLLDDEAHNGVLRWVSDLNRTYRDEPSLHERDTDASGFRWIDLGDAEQGTLSYLRLSEHGEPLLVAMNLTPVPRHDHQVGAPVGGEWTELLNSDSPWYGGGGQGNLGKVVADDVAWRDFGHRISLNIPPLGLVVLKAGSP